MGSGPTKSPADAGLTQATGDYSRSAEDFPTLGRSTKGFPADQLRGPWPAGAGLDQHKG